MTREGKSIPCGLDWTRPGRWSHPERAGRNRRVNKGGIVLAGLWLALALAGCTILHSYTAANTDRTMGHEPTRATMQIKSTDLPGGVFVGIAMSGGGSRAANFSAAVLLELEQLGFLRTTSALSSVSGSSLVAAYYGLFGSDPTRWNPDTVRDLFRENLQSQWIARWFLPHNAVRYWFTDFDRSDIMMGVFDDVLFNGKTFGEMPKAGPRILINATSLPNEGKFVFTDEAFATLDSRLDTYPVSHAVMASGAFPGAFHNVTLRDFRNGGYDHLFDGGAADNLGVETLLEVARRLYDPQTEQGPRGCFFFLVDAYAFERGKGRDEPDTRHFLDFVVDDNVMDSSDVLLSLRRTDILQEAGFGEPGRIGVEPFRQFRVFPGRIGGPHCSAWHITLQGLLVRDDLPPGARAVGKTVNQILTRYRLESPDAASAKELQNQLFEAAKILVRQDERTLRKACEWFRANGVSGLGCP